MNKPKLKDIRITKDNYLYLLNVGDKVWVEEEGNCIATVRGFARNKRELFVLVDGDCLSWPYLENIYLIEDSGCDDSTNESICKECQKKALKRRTKKLQKKLEKLQEQLEEMQCGNS